MGAEIFIGPARVATLPLIFLLGFLVLRPESRRGALFVIVCSMACACLALVGEPRQHRLDLFCLALCFSIVIFGIVALGFSIIRGAFSASENA